MNVTRKQEHIIRRALADWKQQGRITDSEHAKLAATLNTVAFDWQRLSRYAFWTATACMLTALVSFLADSVLVSWLLVLFSDSWMLRIGCPFVLAVLLYLWGFHRQRRETQWHYSTEAIVFLGVVFTALMLWQLGERLDNGSGHVAPLFLTGCAIYGTVAWSGRSGQVWLFFLLALGSWFGAETGYVSGRGAYWLGMNYPIRFVLFGGALLVTCLLLRDVLAKRRLFTISKATGLTYLFIALWIMSIFGNYDPDRWSSVAREALILWALLFAVAAGLCIYISLRTDDGMLRGFGLTFLVVNLYTRFFEYFWDSLHKVVFFLIIAISLAVVGRYAERIWHAGSQTSPDDGQGTRGQS
ncbi:DUF2157 domain-containing protein [Salmonella enterica]|uniref:DUF2157 domain-containing protein n=3 Tax=Salmonella enterica TaxID=28901 RepID=A0A3Y9JCL3_SALET|nr:DUF2157 domain-containing protein [Salmonella enterica subsp. enterica serovar Miami]EAA4490767.1 DUF2157 domain-containing protein [Salmonella enterica subsp. enterica]EAN7518001.1 DUF2157 domain-containing protein [Salmonella enterica]EBM1014698.1 DUF2157 domain-containing protein [Salmonella enterica subsp. enterica serovar Paratyphi B]ECA3525043.1 DUF2157 domain-containing protein [Salmonella enterica subsp. enterica serovar Telhashomer]EDT1785650.1 DUF2157 domain-containing protein [Sa